LLTSRPATRHQRIPPTHPQLAAAVVNVAEAALSVIDLCKHSATHPRLGAVDHVSCHPVPEHLGDLGVSSRNSLYDAGFGGGSGSGACSSSCSSSSSSAENAQQERNQAGAAASSCSTSSSSPAAERQAALQMAARLAGSIGQRLAGGAAQLPVYYYGAAHPEGRRLAEVRRQLGEYRNGCATAVCCCVVIMA